MIEEMIKNRVKYMQKTLRIKEKVKFSAKKYETKNMFT